MEREERTGLLGERRAKVRKFLGEGGEAGREGGGQGVWYGENAAGFSANLV